jgi:3-hydroxyacyl-CoA dehydrogenase
MSLLRLQQLKNITKANNSQLLKSFSTSSSLSQIKKVVVIGSGLMGSGIVQVTAASNLSVTMVDLNDKALANGEQIIHKSLARVAKKKFPDQVDAQNDFIKGVLKNIKISTEPVNAVKDADLVIEAIVENLDKKRQLFAQLDKAAPASAIFCSNTSSLSITDIAESTQRKDKFAGLHFFNPVPQMKLVEIVKASETSQQTHDALADYCKALKKSAVSCKDTPGFIVNRLLVPYMMEAVRLLERDEATIEDIDTAMKLGAGYPMGPFELMDYVGLDTLKFITDGWYQDRGELKGNPLIGPSKILEAKVKEGKLGKKSGSGFYDYSK